MVGEVRSQQLAKANDVEFYRPGPRERSFLMVTARSPPNRATAGIVRAALNRLDKVCRPPDEKMDAIAAHAGPGRLPCRCGSVPGIALLLAVVGIYGAVAYTVEQRTGEIGVRMALGAQTMDVLRLIILQGMQPVFIGLVIGIAAALGLGRLLSSQLYQVSAHSPTLLSMTSVLLAAVALFACLIPARRASQVNPIEALRTD